MALQKQHNHTYQEKLAAINKIKQSKWSQRNGYPAITQGVVSTWLQEEGKIRKMAEDSISATFKQPQIVKYLEVEGALATWVLQALAKGIAVMEQILCLKAILFAEMQGIPKEDFLSVSNGRVQGFKAQHALRHYWYHGKAASVKPEHAEEEITRL
ncbi:hypothetical protein CALCODRAFT_513487 [Calocera cornea HHB12733]|uniref:HTH CENPB-type domain-containing protein n=1 Tax=Calocera cornea HHB12733 TaxID=1353952 RepID=A0A165C1T6_9BASI|nr:hypothetical protein CALCODRAFT_513487 [Calocera cornea HHB12733]